MTITIHTAHNHRFQAPSPSRLRRLQHRHEILLALLGRRTLVLTRLTHLNNLCQHLHKLLAPNPSPVQDPSAVPQLAASNQAAAAATKPSKASPSKQPTAASPAAGTSNASPAAPATSPSPPRTSTSSTTSPIASNTTTKRTARYVQVAIAVSRASTLRPVRAR